MTSKQDIANRLAETALDIGAIRLSPEAPFTWASGYQMPVYNDNRLLLGKYQHRRLVADGFLAILKDNAIEADVVAGTATAGIAPATTLADRLEKPLIYIRPQAKKHGMGNRIEGVLKAGERVVLVEDLISTGQSALSALEAIREAGGRVTDCLSIFHYGFPEADDAFGAQGCRLNSLLTFKELVARALALGRITGEQMETLRPWREDPFGWGERNGFPKINR